MRIEPDRLRFAGVPCKFLDTEHHGRFISVSDLIAAFRTSADSGIYEGYVGVVVGLADALEVCSGLATNEEVDARYNWSGKDDEVA